MLQRDDHYSNMVFTKQTTVRATIVVSISTVFVLAAIYLSALDNRHISSDEQSQNTPEKIQPASNTLSSFVHEENSRYGLFSNEMICKAITHAMVDTDLSVMTTEKSTNSIVISINNASDSPRQSYFCKKVDNRFYWSNSSRVVSQSIIEVDPTVSTSRRDMLNLYIYESRDISNVVRTYAIDDFK